MRLRILGIMIPIIIVTFSYGIVVGLYEYFPYEELNQVKKTIFGEGDDAPFLNEETYCFKEITPTLNFEYGT